MKKKAPQESVGVLKSLAILLMSSKGIGRNTKV